MDQEDDFSPRKHPHDQGDGNYDLPDGQAPVSADFRPSDSEDQLKT